MKIKHKKTIIFLVIANLALFGLILLQPARLERTHLKIDYIHRFYQAPQEFKTLILGDSTIAFGVNPIKMKNAISLALPGATMLTVKNELVRYLKNKKAPQCLILSTASIKEYYEEYFWTIYVSSGMYNRQELEEIYQNSVERNIYPANQYSKLTFQLKVFFYKYLYFSAKNQNSLQLALGINKAKDQKMIDHQNRLMLKSNGFLSPKEDKNGNLVTKRNTYLFYPFEKNISDDLYFEEILSLTGKAGIKLYYLEMPILFRGKSELIDFHNKHMHNISAILSNHPHAELIRLPEFKDEKLFHDLSHLNPEGALVFTDQLNQYLQDKCSND